MIDERLNDLVDNDWRNDKLPNEDIMLPLDKLPDPEDSENQTMKEVVSYRKITHLYKTHDFIFINYRKISGLILLLFVIQMML